jgi:hypothetical protein
VQISTEGSSIFKKAGVLKKTNPNPDETAKDRKTTKYTTPSE